MTAIITEKDLLRLKIEPKSVDSEAARIVSLDPQDPVNMRRFSLSKHWVQIILSRHNQDVGCLVNGNKGTGKSNFGLAVLWECAVLLTRHYGESDPRDRFNIDRCAIMDDDESIDLLKEGNDRTSNPLTLLDDYGKTARARKWQSKTNEVTNDIQDMNRTLNGITVMNTVDQNRIDKYQREIGRWYVESVFNPAAMEHGFTLMKVMVRVKNFRTREEYFQYPYYRDCQVQRIAVKRAPKWLEDEYDKKRERNEKRARQGEVDRSGEPTLKEARERVGVSRAKKRAAEMQVEYDKLALIGMPHMQILKELNIPASTWTYWRSRGFVTALPMTNRGFRQP